MKLTFFTTQKNSPATLFYLEGFKSLTGLTEYSSNWMEFDVALIMGFKDDFWAVREAKKINPSIKIGIVDPRGRYIGDIKDLIDFFVVDSLEMIDFFSYYSKPIFQYYEYFPVTPRLKQHTDKEEIVIGYHGNKVHLMSMWPGVSEAVEKISKERNVVFKVIYNKKKLGQWELGAPQNIKIQHVQLDEETYQQEIQSCDIGIVPAFCPVPEKIYKPSFVERKIYLLDEDDYILRFKVPSNAGRIIVFALLGVPVVADMLPSSCQLIDHGENGFLAYSGSGWYQSLLRLIDSAELREKFSKKLYAHTLNKVDYSLQNQKFVVFLDNLKEQKRESQQNELLDVKFQRLTVPQLNLKYLKKKALGGRGTLL